MTRADALPTRRTRLLLLPAVILLLGGLPGCLETAGQAPSYSALPEARIASVSRVRMPISDGQTIIPPQKMADVQTLWAPLTARERSRPAKQDGLTSAALASLPLSERMRAWLPASEEDTMRRYLYRLTVSHKALTRTVLARAELYLPAITSALRERGLPLELACLPLVESAFEPAAVSPAGAAGLWQLMPATARRFGLMVTRETDERFDPVKSTRAALEYLTFLHGRFGDWPLALAAYNCGEGAMGAALERSGTNTLCDLSTACRSGRSARPLTEETLSFVPRFVAAVLVMQSGGAAQVMQGGGAVGFSAVPPLSGGRPVSAPFTEKNRETAGYPAAVGASAASSPPQTPLPPLRAAAFAPGRASGAGKPATLPPKQSRRIE